MITSRTGKNVTEVTAVMLSAPALNFSLSTITLGLISPQLMGWMLSFFFFCIEIIWKWWVASLVLWATETILWIIIGLNFICWKSSIFSIQLRARAHWLQKGRAWGKLLPPEPRPLHMWQTKFKIAADREEICHLEITCALFEAAVNRAVNRLCK